MSGPSWQAYCMGDLYLEPDPEVSKAIYFQKQKLSYSKSGLKENWTSMLFSDKIYNTQKKGQCLRTNMKSRVQWGTWCPDALSFYMSGQFWFCQWIAFIQWIDILPRVTSKCIDCRWLGFLRIRFAFFHLGLVAEVLCWMLFSKLVSPSQLLEPQHVPRAHSLPELLSFAVTVISKTPHHSAWYHGKWKGLLHQNLLVWG